MKSQNVGICTWSLLNDPDRVTQVMQAAGITSLHLDVSALDSFKPAIQSNGWSVSAMMISFPQEDYTSLESIKKTGGIIPDNAWPANRQLTISALKKAADMQVPFLSTHAGFIDHRDRETYKTFCNRILQLADAAEKERVQLLLETGQETAGDLVHFLKDLNHPAVGVNFDPANMVLYGKGDPIEAIHQLAPWIKHVHIKDAVPSDVQGCWGTEVPWGKGAVEQSAFFAALESIGYDGAIAIEREAGEQREVDILHAANQLRVTV